VWRAPGVRICYVSQEPMLNADATVFEEVARGLGGLCKLLSDYHHLSHQLAEPDADYDVLLEAMQPLQTQPRSGERMGGAGTHRDSHPAPGAEPG